MDESQFVLADPVHKARVEMFLYAMRLHLGRMEDLFWDVNLEGPAWRGSVIHHWEKISESLRQVKLLE